MLNSFIFDASKGQTPEGLARQRALAAQIMGQMGPRQARNASEGIGNAFASIGQGISANVLNRRANATEAEGQKSANSLFDSIVSGITTGSPIQSPTAQGFLGGAPTGGGQPLDPASARVAQAHGDPAIRDGIIQTAESLGIDPIDLATAISYETGGTFSPTQKGPTTQWGQHRGLIQFGEPQAKEHGVNWNDPVASQLGPNGAVASYLRSTGVQPGMGMLDIYSAINAGGVGRYNRSDANNGGAPGTVRDKVEQQMAGHRQKAQSLIGEYQPTNAAGATEAMATGQMVGQPQPMNPGIGPEASSLTGKPVNANMPMAGGGGFGPMDQQQPQPQPVQMAQAGGGMPMQQQGGTDIQALMQAAANPWLNDQQRGVINLLIQQQMKSQDPAHQLEMQQGQLGIEKTQLELEQLRNPRQEQTAEMQNLSWRASQAGLQPGTAEYNEFMRTGGRNDGTNITVNNGEGDKFYQKLDESQAGTFGALSETGVQARSKMAQIDRLEGLLSQAETGGLAMIKQAAGEYGIATEGLSDIQAAQALINELVPQQRQPGSGPMSDADLALFKQSLPRLINQPGGNQTIINTMRGITQYQVKMGEIADAVADRQLTPAQAREQIRSLPNPLAGITEQENRQRNRTTSGVEWSIEE